MRQQVAGSSFSKVLADPSFHPSQSAGEPAFLVAVSDSETRSALAVIMKAFALNARWVSSVSAAHQFLESGEFAVCICGFALDGGSFQDVARTSRHQPVNVPFIMVSSPRPLNEYQDYLASMKVGAFDFICYPYERNEVARILRRAVAAHLAAARSEQPV